MAFVTQAQDHHHARVQRVADRNRKFGPGHSGGRSGADRNRSSNAAYVAAQRPIRIQQK